MKRNHTKILSVILTVALIGSLIASPTAAGVAKAANTFPDPVLKIHVRFVNGIERDIILTQNEESGQIIAYFKIGDEEPIRFGRDIDAGFDRYGAIWVVDKELGGCIGWWSYELAGGDTCTLSSFTLIADPENPMDFLQGIDSLVYEGTGAVVTGYKDSSRKTHPLTLLRRNEGIDGSGSTVPEPSYVPSVPVETPTPSPTVTPQESVSILNTYIGYVDGVDGMDKIEQTLLITKDESGKIIPSFTIEGWDFYEDLDYYQIVLVDAAVDKYGSLQLLQEDERVLWWNYYVTPDISSKTYTFLPDLNSIESFIFDGSGSQAVIVGYRSTTG